MGRIWEAIFGGDNKPKQEPKKKKSMFSTHDEEGLRRQSRVPDVMQNIFAAQPRMMLENSAMDDSSTGQPLFKQYYNNNTVYSELIMDWYTSQSFIGHQLCGIIAQHWLVNKACSMPAYDAVRKGWAVVKDDGEDLEEAQLKQVKKLEKKFSIKAQMREYIRKGRVFGIRVAMFKVKSTDPLYYEKPFNIDGIKKGSFEGIVQIDPYWIAPMLDQDSASRPDSLHFYDPTYWMINGKKHHRSHLVIFRNAPTIDILKPVYLYGGVPLPQMLYERVYASERTANEAPQLVQTKRTKTWMTDIESFMANETASIQKMQQNAAYADNYGFLVGDKEGDEFSQHETGLADLDNVIMTQYQLVAAIANVPATKLLGTQPKGFNSTGEYEEASYHEMLESMQENDLTPFAERFYQIAMKSEMGVTMDISINWMPLDSPTAKELAETNLLKAQTGQALVMSGAIDSNEERQRIATDKQSGYNEMGLSSDAPGLEDDDETDENIKD